MALGMCYNTKSDFICWQNYKNEKGKLKDVKKQKCYEFCLLMCKDE